MRQTLGDGVIYEFITIEARQTIGSTEPQVTKRIGNDFVDTVTRQTVSSGVRPNGKLFSAALRTGDQNEQEDGDNSLHGADMIVESNRL
jgi:hypothetical protein